jgi:hypothetical protein
MKPITLRESIDRFRAHNSVGRVDQAATRSSRVESFDPTDEGASYPDITKAAGEFKRASQQTDALRAQGDDPSVQRQLWQAHRAKKDAHAALLGRTILDFPHLGLEDAMCVAGRHIKRGNMQPFEHIAVLSDFYGARDHNENGVTFNTPYRKTRADIFMRCLSQHYPNIQAVVRDMPTEGLILVQFPNGEHVPPQQPEEPQNEEPQDEAPQQDAPPEQQAPDASQQANQVDPAAMSAMQGAAESICAYPFQPFHQPSNSARQRSWDVVTRLHREAEALRVKASSAYYRRDTMSRQIMAEANDAYEAAKRAEREHDAKFTRRGR